MKQVAGQITLDDILNQKMTIFPHCGQCVCRKCLYGNSGRCPYGECYDDYRARKNPYDKAHPDEPPRTAWSDWNKPGEQAHWCRGGILYPVTYCKDFVKYQGLIVEECINCKICVFQDGYVSCNLKDIIGCDVCIERAEKKEERNQFDCSFMTDTGCEKMITAKNLMLDAIAEGENIEICREQCCIGCKKSCGYRCSKANK